MKPANPRADALRRLLVAAVISCFAACTSIAPAGDARATSDRAAMQAALQASADAWNRGDLRGHLAIYDGSVDVITKNGPRPGIPAIESAFRATYFVGDRPKQDLGMQSVAIRMLSPDSALMTGRFVLSGGGLPELSGWFTLVWLRTPAGWRVVHDHTS